MYQHSASARSQLSLGPTMRRALALVLCGLLPVAVFALMLALSLHRHYAFDFHGAFWQAGRDVLDGRSPYPPATRAALAAGDRFVYPPPLALAMVPLGALPFPLAAALVTLLLTCAVAGALWLLGVRDWRCYGLTLGCAAVAHGIRLGAISALLVLGLALAWRWRERRLAAAGVVAALVCAKLFLWPLVVWLAATRRGAGALLACLLAVLATLGGWAVIGFAGLRQYPHMLSLLASLEQDRGYSLVAAGHALGLQPGASRALALGVGGALLCAAVVVARREEGDRRAFSLAIVAALALTPVVWLHYLSVLVVPIALVRPRLSPLWLALPALWITPFEENFGASWRILAGQAVVALVLVAALRLRRGDAAPGVAPRRVTTVSG